MNQLTVTGTQAFMGVDIPVVLGGFGAGKKSICDKTIAEIHGQPAYEIRRRISDNIKRFAENVDFVDLAQRMGESQTSEIATQLGYSKQAITQAERIYILSERGYAKLIKIMDTDLAWEVHDKLIDEYFEMREHIQTSYTGLSPQLQLLINMEVEQKRQAAALVEVNTRVDNISEIVSLDANAWRDRSKRIIVKIADKWGGAAYIQEVHKELYRLLEQSARVNLKRRLDNRKSRMLTEGASKTAIHKVNNLDIIADDPKLVPIYLDLVKRMAIRHEISVQGLLDEVAV